MVRRRSPHETLLNIPKTEIRNFDEIRYSCGHKNALEIGRGNQAVCSCLPGVLYHCVFKSGVHFMYAPVWGWCELVPFASSFLPSSARVSVPICVFSFAHFSRVVVHPHVARTRKRRSS